MSAESVCEPVFLARVRIRAAVMVIALKPELKIQRLRPIEFFLHCAVIAQDDIDRASRH